MEKRNLLILGAGQYGFVARDVARAMGCYEKIDFLDDNSPLAVGKVCDCEALCGAYGSAMVAIGRPELRLQLIERLQKAGFDVPVLVHPQAVVMPSAKLGAGSVVEPMAVVNSNAEVGVGCIISAGAVVNHNAVLGSSCHVDCNATVSARGVLPPGTKVSCGTVYEEK